MIFVGENPPYVDHWVALRLPDGRHIFATHDEPLAAKIRQVHLLHHQIGEAATKATRKRVLPEPVPNHTVGTPLYRDEVPSETEVFTRTFPTVG